jgi:hypothetical protein
MILNEYGREALFAYSRHSIHLNKLVDATLDYGFSPKNIILVSKFGTKTQKDPIKTGTVATERLIIDVTDHIL